MRHRIEAVEIEGQTVRVTAHAPLPVAPRALAAAAAVRVLDRYPALDGLTLVVGEMRVTLSRPDVERLLGPEGFARLKERQGTPELLERVIRQFTENGAE